LNRQLKRLDDQLLPLSTRAELSEDQKRLSTELRRRRRAVLARLGKLATERRASEVPISTRVGAPTVWPTPCTWLPPSRPAATAS
jgi:hypothetical protein